MGIVYLSLGSNLGDRHSLLSAALDMLQTRAGRLLTLSRFYETEPWGFESPHPFLNAVVALRSKLKPQDILHITQAIERELGRTQKSNGGIYHDRPIDIDILLHTTYPKVQSPELELPHPQMWQRDFVRMPLSDVAPWLHPDEPSHAL